MPHSDRTPRDPSARARRRRSLGIGLFGLAALLGLTASVAARHSEMQACEAGEQVIAGVWNPERRESLARQFATFSKPYSDFVAARLLDQLDAYAYDWERAHEDACLAGQRGEQSDARMACLERSRAAFASTVELLAEADEAVFERAPTIALELPPPSACNELNADDERLAERERLR